MKHEHMFNNIINDHIPVYFLNLFKSNPQGPVTIIARNDLNPYFGLGIM